MLEKSAKEEEKSEVSKQPIVGDKESRKTTMDDVEQQIENEVTALSSPTYQGSPQKIDLYLIDKAKKVIEGTYSLNSTSPSTTAQHKYN